MCFLFKLQSQSIFRTPRYRLQEAWVTFFQVTFVSERVVMLLDRSKQRTMLLNMERVTVREIEGLTYSSIDRIMDEQI